MAARANVIDPTIKALSGRIVKYTGDGFLAEFLTVQDAVECAIAMQEDLTDVPLEFRMGVNLGDIVDDGTDIHGEGVNIAARIEALAEPGGISISGGVYEQIRNRIDATFDDFGEHEVKHVSTPVRVYIHSGSRKPAAVAAPYGTSKAAKPSIVILPFWRRWGLVTGCGIAAVAVAIIIGSVLLQRHSNMLTSFPLNVSTDELRASEIEAFMSGMIIQGNRNIDNQIFTITVNADKTLTYQFARTGNLSGTMERVSGTWASEDYRFCMQVQRFASGRKICPRIVKEGQKLYATRRNGTALPWAFSKE